MHEIARDRDASAQEVGLASEVATIGIGVLFLVSAALPTTDDPARVGLLTSAVFLFLFTAIWFHLLPAGAFGERRVLPRAPPGLGRRWVLLFLAGRGSSRGV